MSENLASVLHQHADLTAQLKAALQAGEPAERLVALAARLQVLEELRNELAHGGGPDNLAMGLVTGPPSRMTGDRPRAGHRRRPPETAPPPPDPYGRPLREVILDALTFLGRPASVMLISDLVRARDGLSFPSSRLASLRRDEERSFDSSSSRAAYVVPAMTYDRFAPVRGVLASSAFPLAHRLIAPASGRVDFLHAIAAIADDTRARRAAGESTDALDALLRRVGRSVPGALAGGSFADVEPALIAEAARAELAIHQDADDVERTEAAQRARAQLDARAQLFGHRPKVHTTRPAKEA